MPLATPRLRRVARRLLVLEASPRRGEAGASAAFSVSDRLRLPLSTLAGMAGFRSLLSRALVLATKEVRWLKAVHVNADGSLAVADDAQLSDAEIAEGEATLIAELIGLLVTFIGEGLTLHLLQEAWPEASLGGLDGEPENEE